MLNDWLIYNTSINDACRVQSSKVGPWESLPSLRSGYWWEKRSPFTFGFKEYLASPTPDPEPSQTSPRSEEIQSEPTANRERQFRPKKHRWKERQSWGSPRSQSLLWCLFKCVSRQRSPPQSISHWSLRARSEAPSPSWSWAAAVLLTFIQMYPVFCHLPVRSWPWRFAMNYLSVPSRSRRSFPCLLHSRCWELRSGVCGQHTPCQKALILTKIPTPPSLSCLLLYSLLLQLCHSVSWQPLSSSSAVYLCGGITAGLPVSIRVVAWGLLVSASSLWFKDSASARWPSGSTMAPISLISTVVRHSTSSTRLPCPSGSALAVVNHLPSRDSTIPATPHPSDSVRPLRLHLVPLSLRLHCGLPDPRLCLGHQSHLLRLRPSDCPCHPGSASTCSTTVIQPPGIMENPSKPLRVFWPSFCLPLIVILLRYVL